MNQKERVLKIKELDHKYKLLMQQAFTHGDTEINLEKRDQIEAELEELYKNCEHKDENGRDAVQTIFAGGFKEVCKVCKQKAKK